MWPCAQDSFDDPTQALLVSEEEIEILGHLEGEQIAGIMQESPLEEVDGAFPFATGPGLRGEHMEELAFAGTQVPAVESHDELRRRLESGLGSRVQRQVGLEDASEDEVGVGCRCVSESDRLAAQGDQVLYGMLEQGDRAPVGCEHRAAPGVDECATQRCLLPSHTILAQAGAAPVSVVTTSASAAVVPCSRAGWDVTVLDERTNCGVDPIAHGRVIAYRTEAGTPCCRPTIPWSGSPFSG